MKTLELLKGKKTYIVGVLAAIYALLTAFGVINLNSSQEDAINLLALALFGITFRDAIKK